MKIDKYKKLKSNKYEVTLEMENLLFFMKMLF